MSLLQVYNGDAVTIVVNVRFRFWIPTTKLVAEVNACVEQVFWCGIHTVFKAQRTTPGETMFLLIVCYGCWSEIPHFPNSRE